MQIDGRVRKRLVGDSEPTGGDLRVIDLSMSFGDIMVLQEFDMTVADGEFVSLLGASGCGKTTLLNLIAGFLEPTHGSIQVSGRPIHGPGPDRTMVFQDDAVFPWYTVLQNVAYGLRVQGISREERRIEAQELVRLVGLGGREDAFPLQLSGGMRKRVDLARALATEPKVLLMDEPFAALDAITKSHLQTEFLKISQERRTTVVFVTHDVEEALFLSDRVFLMGGKGIVEETTIPFQRPRTEAMRTSAELQKMRGVFISRLAQLSSIGEKDGVS